MGVSETTVCLMMLRELRYHFFVGGGGELIQITVERTMYFKLKNIVATNHQLRFSVIKNDIKLKSKH